MVRIISVKHIKEFSDSHPEHSKSIEAWLSIIKACEWEKPQDIVEQFGRKAVDILGKKKKNSKSPERVIIDIKGNHIRVIFKYQFIPKLKKTILYVKWIGTHAEYDVLSAQEKQYDVDMFEKKED